MALELKSLLRDQKLRSGIKALVVFLSFFFLPVWLTGIIAALLYSIPLVFTSEFFGSFLVLGFAAFSFIGHFPLWMVALISSAAFFVILGIKNVFISKRVLAFLGVVTLLFVALSFGMFSGFISIPLFAVACFLIARDGFKSFTVLSQRANAAAAILSLALSEIAWVINWLLVSKENALSAVIIELIFIAAAVNLIFRHLRGEISNARAIFWSLSLVIIGVFGMLIVAFG